MKFMIYILVMLGLVIGCKTQKKVTNTKEQMQTDSQTQKRLSVIHRQSVREFGDTLTADSYIPKGFVGSIKAESKGVKTKVDFVPVKDSSGKLVGSKVNVKSIAKPKKEVNGFHQSQFAEEQKTASSKEVRTHEKNKKKSNGLFSILNWKIWLLIAAVVLFFLIRYLRRYIKYFI